MQTETKELLTRVCHSLQTVASMVRDDTTKAVSTEDHIEVIRHYNDVRLATATIKEAREALDAIEKQLSSEIVPDFMKRAKVKTTTIEGVGRVTVAYRYSCSMIDKPRGLEHLRDIGQGGLIQETVASSTLSAFAKQWIEEEGKELPDDIFKTGSHPYTSITKVK